MTPRRRKCPPAHVGAIEGKAVDEEKRGLKPYGRISRFSEAAGMDSRYMSHVVNGRKPLGHASCRTIEHSLGLPNGWLDTPHGAQVAASSPLTDGERDFIDRALALYRPDPTGTLSALLDAATRRR